MKEKSGVLDQCAESRESIRDAYSGRAKDDDDEVRGDHAGRLLGDYDITIVKKIVPFVAGDKAKNLEVGSGTG